MKSLRVAISGAGVGGLCLAQGLAKAGISATVFEKDESAHSRGQGYRLRIDADGQQALASCLSDGRYALFHETCSRPGARSRFIDSRGLPHGERRPESWQPDADVAAHRQTLREILIQGIEDRVRFGRAVCGFDEHEDGVDVTSADGRRERFDLLVAADGVFSTLRERRVPDATVEDIGAVNIYGKTPLSVDICARLQPELVAGVTVVFADGLSLIIEPMRFHRPPHVAGVAAVEDYLYWAFIARAKLPPGTGADALLRHIAQLTQAWHPQFQPLFASCDRSALSSRPVLMARSVPQWTPGRVTLLGDAIHAMSPAGGLGANTALRDASHLSQALAHVGPGDDLRAAIGHYEAGMRKRAALALQASRSGTERLLRPGG